jgi:ABC-type multidrug transport system fused ATPase/permease subunit
MSDADLDDAMVSIPGTNLTTALLHGTTIKNDAFGVEAGLCVSILLLQINSNITNFVLPANALAYQDSLADLAKTIASNDMMKERVATFLGSDVPATKNFSCSSTEEKNIPACEPKKELPLSELFQEITANDNWCTADNTVSSSKCDQYLQSISSFITPIPAVPNWLFALSIAVACLFPLLYLALAFRKGKKQKWEESGDVDIYSASAATAKEIKLVGLNVVSDEGAKILENVSLHLKPGTMNGLLGLSGSGEPFFCSQFIA